MLPISINSLLDGSSSVEWERIEFKEGWNPLDVIQTLCAFANDFNNLDGGYICIGVAEDDGKPIFPPKGLSQSQIDKIQKELLQFGNDKINPPYFPIAFPYHIDGKNILILRAPGGQNRPYRAVGSLAKGDKSRNYYIRKLSSTVEARGNDLTELLTLAQNVPFDDRYNQQATMADLEFPLIKSFLENVKSDLAAKAGDIDFEALCRQMKIVGSATEHPLPHNVGLMFFNSRPDNFFPHSQIDVVRFPDGTGGDALVEERFFGPINEQINSALAYIRDKIIEGFILKNPTKAEADKFFNYPYQAIEEILVNAVYHRSYQLREPIEVRILPDRITIVSYPGPDRSIKLEALASGNLVARRYRNRRIGEFLKELRLTEGRGTGIPKAIRVMIENGSPQPIFETDEDRNFFFATLMIHPQFAQKGGKVGVSGGKIPPPSSEDVVQVLNDRAIALLNYCVLPRTRAEIMEHLDLRDRKHLRERYIYPLMSARLLSMTSLEPGSRVQVFQVTRLGSSAVKLYKRRNEKPNIPSLFDNFE